MRDAKTTLTMLVRSGGAPGAPVPVAVEVSVVMACLSSGVRAGGGRGSSGGPAAVEEEGRSGHRGRGGSAEERDRLGDLLRLDEPADGRTGQQDGVEDFLLGDAVAACLVGELALDEGRPDVAGADG